jgi:hypothetical protein
MYLFHLGNNPDLSRWELQSLLPNIVFNEHPYGVICADAGIDDALLAHIQKRAGGLREVIHYRDQSFEEWKKAVMSLKDTDLEDKEVALHAPTCDEKQREQMLLALKRYWHERTGKSLRFRLNKTYLVGQGGNVLWWLPNDTQPGTFFLGRTITQQTIRDYAKRDYDKPARSMQRGMLPPKLAQIMINGAGIQDSQMLWDPFCGTGTVLIESALMQLPCIGSDNELSAIRETQENMASILDFSNQKYIQHLWQQNIMHQWTLPCDDQNLVIVAEGYLGPIQNKVIAPGDELRAFWQKVEPLYQKFFFNLLKSKINKMVLATPIVIMADSHAKLANRTWDILLKQGWNMSFSTEYIRASQFIGRHIACLQRN